MRKRPTRSRQLFGNDNNDGLTAATPKRSLQSVLTDPLRPLNVGDVILLDAGTYVGTAITGTSPTGVIIIGSSDEPSVIQTPLAISNVDRLTVSRLQAIAGVAITNSTQVTLQENDCATPESLFLAVAMSKS